MTQPVLQPNIPTRDNNPGDLKDLTSGQFRTFANPEEGFAALKGDLQAKISGKTRTGLNANSTLAQFSNVWAPASDKNDPMQYAMNLAKKMGVSVNATIGSLGSRLDDFAKAIADNEGFGAKTAYAADTTVTGQGMPDAQFQQLLEKAKSAKTTSSKGMPDDQFQALLAKAKASKGNKTKTGGFFDSLRTGLQSAESPIEQAKGFVKGAVGTVKDLGVLAGKVESKIPGPVGKFLGGAVDEGTAIDKSGVLNENTPGQKVGGVLENVAEFAIGPGETKEAAKVAEKGGVVAKKTGALAKVLALGKEGVQTLERLGNEETQKFIKGKTFAETEKVVSDAVSEFAENSKKALKAVKDKLPNDNTIDPGRIGKKVDQAIADTFNKGAEYKGVLQRTFKGFGDVVKKGLLNPDEAKVVKGMIQTISDWGDFSSRGILNLKEALAPFEKTGAENANAVLRSIQRTLKDVVSDSVGSGEIKTALKTASENIERGEDFERALTGTNPQQLESRLLQIVKGLKEPALNADKLKMIQELEDATGKKIMPELKGFADYLENQGANLKTKGQVVARGAARATKALVGTGVIAEGVRGLESIFGAKSQSQ